MYTLYIYIYIEYMYIGRYLYYLLNIVYMNIEYIISVYSYTAEVAADGSSRALTRTKECHVTRLW